MKNRIILLIVFILNNNCYAQRYTDKYIKEANVAAEIWFDKINTQKFNASYEMLAIELKEKYNEERWSFFMNNLMIEFGEINSRKMQESLFKSKIDGLEDGFYVLIEYKSDYSNTEKHFEFLVLKQNDNMKWCVLDYYYEFEEKTN
tara:strand:+ start:123 stop:560 length:438 start_codon:yes stop_codon:yes gene_type:complete